MESARLAFRFGIRKAHSAAVGGFRRSPASAVRSQVEAELAVFSRGGEEPLFRRVLFDGMWDNPNLWLRIALTRRAIGSAQGTEIGIADIHSLGDGPVEALRPSVSTAASFGSGMSLRQARRITLPTA